MPTRSAPIRILHVVHSMAPGGMERGLLNLYRGLDRRLFELHFCCLSHPGSLATAIEPADRIVALHKRDGVHLSLIASLVRHLRRLRPDIVHTHNLGPFIYGVPATMMAGPVALVHGEHRELMQDELRWPKRWLRRCLYQACRQVITVSDGLKHSLVAQGFPSSRLLAIPNGVDTELFLPGDATLAHRALGLPDDSLIVGIVARLRPEKGHRLLLDAFSRVAESHPRWRLLVVGDGPEMHSLRTQAGQLAVTHRIQFVSHQTNLMAWYQAMSLMVLPSRAEGLSNAILEAMACGVPVLSTHACGNADMITDGVNGFLRDLDTPEALSKALGTILESPGLPAVGRCARETVMTQFSLPTMIQRYSQLYLDLMRTH